MPLDRRLLALIRSTYHFWEETLGYRRVHDCLLEDYAEKVGARRVRRLMRTAKLMGIPKKKRPSQRRAASSEDAHIPDLLQRDFSALAPDLVWVTDITEFRTGEGKLYVCMIKDVDDGAVAAWTTSARATALWVVSTVLRAVTIRRPEKGTILHSDHGSQYTSKAYQQCLQNLG